MESSMCMSMCVYITKYVLIVLGVIFLNRPQTSKPGLEMQRFLNVDVFGQFPNITFSFRKH